MKILAIESSCDETAAAVVVDGREVLSNVINTQIEEHKKFGGVVPEIASRRHSENILAVVDEALANAKTTLEEIDAIAVTYAPGLIGALLVGVSFAKGLAFATGKPLIPVHHIAGHIAANYIQFEDLKPPYLALVVSGGHSQIVEVKDYSSFKIVGKTHDDAAGEAYDKVARVLGFPYPGGVYIDKAAALGDDTKYKLPHPKIDGSPYDFSFSGLKTAVINVVHNAEQKGEEICKNDMAASFQKTICEILTDKAVSAAKSLGYNKIVLAGGVSANSGLRSKLQNSCDENGLKLYLPPLSLCGDNAAMIGSAAYFDYITTGRVADLSLNAIPTLSMEKL